MASTAQDDRSAVLEKCRTAIASRDADQFQQLVRTAQLDRFDVGPLWQHAVQAGWVEGARILLAEHNDDVQQGRLIERSLDDIPPSLDLLAALADSGFDFHARAGSLLAHVMDRPELLDWLLARGADLNASADRRASRLKKGEHDRSCGVLNEAAARGDVALFDRLVARGADPQRSLALHMAALCPDRAATAAMIDHLVGRYGLDVNARDDAAGLLELATPFPEDGPPLHYAVVYPNAAAVAALLRHGARASSAAYARAVASRMEDVLGPLLDAGADPTACLCQLSNLERAAVEAEGDGGEPDVGGEEEQLRQRAIQLCLDRGADPDAPSRMKEQIRRGEEPKWPEE